MQSLGVKAADLLEEIRRTKPLVHNITNLVVTNCTANIILNIGALPVMAYAPEEVEEMVQAAGALVLNIGTLSRPEVEAMLLAGKKANECRVPVIFDPVGAGATKLRTESAFRLLEEIRMAVIRGNSAEIAVLGGFAAQIKGVEAVGTAADLGEAAKATARKFGAAVAITGPRDYVSDGRRVVAIDNGHPLLATVTGTGCMSTAVTGAFAAVAKDCLLAAAAALICFGRAGEIAAAKAAGPGSFQTALYDSVYHLNREQVESGAKAIYLEE
ncbi:MAG: hydroxyethylthiazole kinase [bacterium]|jgi:hydroxyethylthiazole kinase